MTRLSSPSAPMRHRLAGRLRAAWLAAVGPDPLEPRLAADAGLQPARVRRVINPLVGAWLH